MEENDTIASINLSSCDGLNRNKLSAPGVEPLELILKSNCTLQFLNLSGTSLNLMGVECIMRGLQDNSSLVYLNIAKNDLGPGLGKILSVYLEKTSIVDLNIC